MRSACARATSPRRAAADLLGADVLKAAAAVVDGSDPQRHLGDLALVVFLMDDPIAERSRLKGSEPGRLLKVRPSLDEASAGFWHLLGTALRTPTSAGTRSSQARRTDPRGPLVVRGRTRA